MAENTETTGVPVLAVRVLALILAVLSLYNIVIPEKIAIGISGLVLAGLAGVVLPIAIHRKEE